jgi:ankyrin repeat protein
VFPTHLPIKQYDAERSNLQFPQNQDTNVMAALFHQKALFTETSTSDLLPSRISSTSAIEPTPINPLKRPGQFNEQNAVKKRRIDFRQFSEPISLELESDLTLLQKLTNDLDQVDENLAIRVIENQGSVELVKFVIEKLKANPNQPDESGQTPLLIGCDREDIAMVKALIELGADPNQVNEKTRENPLFVTAAANDQQLVRTLVACGADPLFTDDITGDTPLCSAVLAGNIETVELLIKEFHLDPNCYHKISGKTPLLLAIKW